jgi:hypothetical protein
MEIVKETEEYQIVKKRSGRYGIRKSDRSWITGEDKVKILLAEGLIKLSEPTKEPEAEEAPAEADEGAEGAADAASDEAAAEEESET